MKRVFLVISLICSTLFFAEPSFALLCGDPDSCVIITGTSSGPYTAGSGLFYTAVYNLDDSCSTLSSGLLQTIFSSIMSFAQIDEDVFVSQPERSAGNWDIFLIVSETDCP